MTLQDVGGGVPVHGHRGGHALQQEGDRQPGQDEQGGPGERVSLTLCFSPRACFGGPVSPLLGFYSILATASTLTLEWSPIQVLSVVILCELMFPIWYL